MANKLVIAPIFFLIGLATQSQQPAPPRDPTPATGGTATISGRITDQASGRPLAKALVTISGIDSASHSFEAVADAHGRYELTGLTPGEYTISATAGELRATHLRRAFGQADPTSPPVWPPPFRVELRAGEVRSDVDIALVRALAIEGRVLDPRDEPMADVEVIALRPNGSRSPATQAYSDDRGDFRLFGLPPGRYRVCAIARNRFRGFDTSRFVRTCHLAATAQAQAADVLLDAEDVTGIDVRMQRVGTYSISGSVIDAAGVSLGGGYVGAMSEDPGVSASTIPRSGRFMLEGLTPGRYLVEAQIGGPANPGDLRPPAREREHGYARVVIEGADASVDLQLSKPRKIPGRVVFEDGPAPRPAQLRIVVQTNRPQEEWRMPGERPPFSAVNEKLEFELSGLYRRPLIVGAHGLPDGWALKSVKYAGRDISYQPTDFGAVPSKGRIDIILTNRVAKPTVRVTTDLREPVISYKIVVILADPARRNGTRWGSGTPARDGSMKLDSMPPGNYLIAAITSDDYSAIMEDPTRLAELSSTATPVTLGDGDDRLIELRLTTLPARQ